MIGRREVMRVAAISAVVASSGFVSACEYATYEKDEWSKKLIAYLRSGDESLLNNLFFEDSTLVAFDSSLIADTMKPSFSGVGNVRKAMIGFRKQLMLGGYNNGARGLKKAIVVGSEQQGRMNKIQILFADNQEVDTSCGPTRSEAFIDLFYEAGVDDKGEAWSVKRIAIIPRLEVEKVNG